IARSFANVPAGLLWLGGMLRMKDFRRSRVEEEDDDRHEPHAEDEEDDGYHFEDEAEPRESIAGRRLAERRESRVKRDAAKKVVTSDRRKQTALNLGGGEYQLPALDLLAEPVAVKENHGLTDEALEENARMLEAVLA